MQDITPLTPDHLLEPLQELLYKVEVRRGEEWIDLCDLGGKNYLVENTLHVNFGGAGVSPLPIAGNWSVEIDNEDGLFHPFHPSSPYAGLFRLGRESRISVGANFEGAPRYWQRLVGFMGAPHYDNVKRTIGISGKDYMKRLADTRLGDEPRVTYAGTGEHDDPDIIDGPTRWGGRVRTLSKPSTGQTGSELYTNQDAVGPANINSMAEWDDGPGEMPPGSPVNMNISVIDLGGGDYAGSFEATASGAWGGCDEVGGPVSPGETNVSVFRYRRTWGSGWALLQATQTISGERTVLSQIKLDPDVPNGTWVEKELRFTALTSGDFGLMVHIDSKDDTFHFTDATVKLYDPVWHEYPLPADCVCPYKVVLDGEQVNQGERDKNGNFDGWLYAEDTKRLRFDPMKEVAGGLSLDIYYYTPQQLDDVMADLLVVSGAYANRSEALAAMDYTPSGITVPRSWFKVGDAALAAVKLICERANYRFWFDYAGAPKFKPAPIPTEPVFVFPKMGHFQNISDFQDLKEVANKVIVEGAERAMFRTRDDKDPSRWVGEAADQALIDESQEVTLPIDNHLFQDQASVDAMAAALLAEFKDPKLYTDLDLFANPVPLELGDTIEWPVEFAPGLAIELQGIIRNIQANEAQFGYTVEITGIGEVEPLEMHALLSETHYDTKPAAPSFGALIYADGDPEIPLGSPGPDQHALLNGDIHPDTESQEPELGGLIMGIDSEPVKWTKLAPGEPGRMLEMGPAAPAWGKKIHSSDAPPGPGDGEDGDVWLEY